MSDIDSELIDEEVESIYSLEYRESKKFKDFLKYLSNKDVCLAVVKCKRISSTFSHCSISTISPNLDSPFIFESQPKPPSRTFWGSEGLLRGLQWPQADPVGWAPRKNSHFGSSEWVSRGWNRRFEGPDWGSQGPERTGRPGKRTQRAGRKGCQGEKEKTQVND